MFILQMQTQGHGNAIAYVTENAWVVIFQSVIAAQ